MFANSRAVDSNQNGVHDKLEETVKKYLSTEFKRPFAKHTLKAFEKAQFFLEQQQKPIILDACCGTAISTFHLASQFPNHAIVGIDQSIHRLSKAFDLPSNAIILQADLVDFYRLALSFNWQLDKHFLLYPNPWPKSNQLKRRWHAMPSFPAMLALGGEIEVRSNWQIYIEEFAIALNIAGFQAEAVEFTPKISITAFEAKYLASQHQFWKLNCQLNLGEII